MSDETMVQYRVPLKRGEYDAYRWRSTLPGMWAWLLQRISALLIIFFLGLHLVLAYRPLIQLLLLMVVTFHAALGLRVILLDLGLVHVRYQRALFGGLMALGILLLTLIWVSIY